MSHLMRLELGGNVVGDHAFVRQHQVLLGFFAFFFSPTSTCHCPVLYSRTSCWLRSALGEEAPNAKLPGGFGGFLLALFRGCCLEVVV